MRGKSVWNRKKVRAPDSEEGTACNLMPPRFITGGLTGGHSSHASDASDACCEEGLNKILGKNQAILDNSDLRLSIQKMALVALW